MKVPAEAFARCLPVFVFCLFFPLASHAQRTWNNAGIGLDWSTTANWVAGEPIDDDGVENDVIIESLAAGSFDVEITQPGEIARVIYLGRTGDDTVTMTGGDLVCRSLRLVAKDNGSVATFNFLDGTITVTDNVTNSAASGGTAIVNNNQAVHISGEGETTNTFGTAVFNMGDIGSTASPVLNYASGRFELSTSNADITGRGVQSAVFNLFNGTVTATNNQNFIIGQRNNNTTSTANIMGGLVDTGAGDTNMNNGNSTLNVSGGEFRTDVLNLQNNLGGNSDSHVNVTGGLLTVQDINDRAGTSELNLQGGTFEIRGGTNRDVDALVVGGGKLRIGTFSQPLSVAGSATITGTPELELFPQSGAGAGLTRWIGGTDVWGPNELAKWEGLVSPDGNVGAGASFNVINASSMTGGNNFFINDPDWSTTQNGNSLAIVSQAGFVTDPLTAFFNGPGDVVSRSMDLVLGSAAGTDAAGVEINMGTLLVPGANEMIIGVPGGAGTVTQTGGNVTLNDDLRYLDTGGTYFLRGGTLNVTGDIVEDSTAVTNAQLYIEGGNLIVGGNITTQSFRTGNTAGFPGIYFLPSGKTLTNTGTFYTGLNDIGLFTVGGGTVNAGATILSENGDAQNSELEVAGGVFNANGTIDIGRRGNDAGGSFLIASGGTFNANATLRFGNNGGHGTVQVDNSSGGGTFVANGNITTGTRGDVFLQNGGTFVLGGDPGTRNISNFSQNSGGVLVLRVPSSLTFISLNVSGTTTVDPGAQVDVQAGFGAGSVVDSVSWIAGNGVWDTSAANWLADDFVTNVIPANGAGFIQTNDEYTFLTGTVGTILNPANLTPNAGWSVINPSGNMNELAVRRTGSQIGVGPALAIISTGVTVNRDTDLAISPAGGSDAAGLDLSGGTQLFVTDAGGDPCLLIGGDDLGVINQGTIGTTLADAVTVDGDLKFGGSGPDGGTYNLNSGTLSIGGSIVEGEIPGSPNPSVNSAQMQINTEQAGDVNALSVGGTIEVQRFSVAEADGAGMPGSPVTHTVMNPLTTSGDLVVGMGLIDGSTYAHGELIADGTGGPIIANQMIIGSQGNPGAANIGSVSGGSSGVVTLSGSQTLDVIGGRLSIAGENNDDVGTAGSFTMGDSVAVSVSGSNTEVGRGGNGTFTMSGGTFVQKTSNFVLGQSGAGIGSGSDPASGIVAFSGGTITVGDGDDGPLNSDLNFNEGNADWTQSGAANLVIERNINLGSGSSNPSSFSLQGNSTVQVGENFDFRSGNGTDTVTIDGAASLDVSRDFDGLDGTNNVFNVLGSAATIQIDDDMLLDGSIGISFTADATGVSKINVGDGIDNPARAREDQLSLNNAVLDVDLSALSGTPVNIVLFDLNATATKVGASGVFAGLPQDAVLTTTTTGAAMDYTIDYAFGPDGNDIALVSVSGPLDDDDGDFIVNLLEDAFDSDRNDPNSGREGLPTISSDGSSVTIQFRVLDSPGAKTYTVQQSIDGVIWTPAPGVPTASVDQSGSTASTTLMELSLALPGPPHRLMLRILVEE
ncbi:MAG: hypothetical protein AAGA58_07475 [Verrucomicrobiota bacterium]